ncbi:MAG: hypothetical protein KKI08_18825, partial [Armatimonadetes bacterium]|nr:hypothetical protein [Armatimonadota bacterium]
LNTAPPVVAASLTPCVAIATRPEESCGEQLAAARHEAVQAEVRCDSSLVERFERYRWTEQASTVHTAAAQPGPRRQKYPRVSCQQAAERLQQAVAKQQDGPWIVLRPLELTIVALSLEDPEALLYCDGFPLPAIEPQQANPQGPIVYQGGPHAVLVRPERSGRFRVRMYCLGCNAVGGE